MKLGKFERALLILAAAALVFTAGYFAGRGRAGDVNVTVTTLKDPSAPPASGGALIDLNTADAWELQTLPGVGETLAGRIIEYRTANGPFRSTGEIMNVRGIGESLYLSIRDLIKV